MTDDNRDEARRAQEAEENRRVHPRFPVEVEVTFRSEHNFYTGFTENISEGGLFVATHCPVPVGTTFPLSFTLQGVAEPIQVTCEVRWVRPYHEGLDAPPGLGVRFLDLQPAARSAIQHFLKARGPIFYDD